MSSVGVETDSSSSGRYQVLPDLSEEEYQALKKDIAENGVQVDVAVDEEGNIIDGHHRVKACEELGIDDYPKTVYPGRSKQEKRDLAYKLNLQRRQVSETTKIDVAKQYLLDDWDGIETQQAIAEKLGCSRQLITEAKSRVNSKLDVVETDANVGSGSTTEDNETNSPTRLRVDSDDDVEKVREIREKAEDGSPTAKQEWEQLENGDQSIRGAYTAVVDGNDGNTDSGGSESDSSSDIEPFTSQQTDEWSSPRELVEPLADAIDGFDLDPCSGAEQSPFAAETYTEDDDGLAQEWCGDVWVNPPYSGVSEWVDKATAEIQQDRVNRILFLCKGDSSTEWWNAAAQEASCVLAVDRRLSFGDGENSAPFASHVVVFGDATGLCDALREQGTVLTPGCPNRSGRA